MRCDIAIIGAGPAGLAAAAAARGRTSVVIDLAARPGGQYYRHPQDTPPARPLARLLANTRILSGERVFAIEAGSPHVVHLPGRTIRAESVLIATGAYDRQVPFPGWELPGVLAAGGAQALVKGSHVFPGERIVVAGSGPFLLPVAATLGDRVVAVYDSGSPLGFLRHPGVMARHPEKLVEALGYLRIPLHTMHTVLAAHGKDTLEAITVRGPRRTHRIECDTLAIGHGFVPQIDLGLAIGCRTRTIGGAPALAVNARQQTSVPGIYAAGEVTGIGGVTLAVATGALAGRAMAGLPPTPNLLRARARHTEFAAAMADVWPPSDDWLDRLTDDTLICRCEEVRHRTIRDAMRDLGARDARAVKLMTRAGMGWCQGRMCGEAVACVVGRPDAVVDVARRTLAQPVTLGELAAKEDG